MRLSILQFLYLCEILSAVRSRKYLQRERERSRKTARSFEGISGDSNICVCPGSTRNRSSSPYRQREVSSGSVRSGGSGGAQVNLGYGTNAWADSRRASSSVSQVLHLLLYRAHCHFPICNIRGIFFSLL